ncbi:acyl carrier protein [Oxalobacteraceae bacterium GrIS 1.11]
MNFENNIDGSGSEPQRALAFMLNLLPPAARERSVGIEVAELSLRKLGVSSLGAIAMQYRLSQHFGKRLSLELMLSETSLLRLAEQLANTTVDSEILI